MTFENLLHWCLAAAVLEFCDGIRYFDRPNCFMIIDGNNFSSIHWFSIVSKLLIINCFKCCSVPRVIRRCKRDKAYLKEKVRVINFRNIVRKYICRSCTICLHSLTRFIPCFLNVTIVRQSDLANFIRNQSSVGLTFNNFRHVKGKNL